MGSAATDQVRRSRGRHLLSVSLLALFTAAVYLAFPARLYFGEGFKWALSEPSFTGGLFRFFHPHHLLYNPLGYLLHQVLSLLCPGLSPMISFRLLDTIAGLAGVVVFHQMARRLWQREWAAAFTAAGFAFSWGYWSHTINVEVYSVSVFLLVLGFTIALRILQEPPARPRVWVLLALVSGASVLIHQSNVLFLAVPLTAALWCPGGRRTGLRLFSRMFFPVYSAVTVLPYLAVMGRLGFRTPGQALTWLFLYGHQAETYVGSGPSVIYYAMVSFGRMLLLPASYTAAGAVPPVPVPLLLGLKWAAALLLSLLMLAAVLRFRALAGLCGPCLRLGAALTVPYVLFFTFWDPGGYFFWLPLGIPFWLVAGGAVAALPSGTAGRLGLPVLGLAVLALMAVNFLGGVLPESQRSRVVDHRLIELTARHMEPGDLLLLNSPRMEVIANFGGPMFYGYARAFGDFEVQCLFPAIDDPDQASLLEDDVSTAGRDGHGVWYLDEVLYGRSSGAGREAMIIEAFGRWQMRKLLVEAHPGADVYNGSILFRLVPDLPPRDALTP